MLSLTLARITSALNTNGHTVAFVVASELRPDVGLGWGKKKKNERMETLGQVVEE